MKAAIALAVMSFTTIGCATATPSTYTDTSTAEQKNIQATGAAAVEAARANQNRTLIQGTTAVGSPNTLVWDGVSVDHMGNPIIYGMDGKPDYRASIRFNQRRNQYKQPGLVDWAVNDFKRDAEYKAKRKIRRKINKITDKLF